MHPVHAMQKPIQFQDFPDALKALAPYGPYRAIVRRIIDGDTLELLVSCGFHGYQYVSIRLHGVNAPEMFSGTSEERERGRAAKAFVQQVCGPGTPCVIATWKDRQTFGRWLGTVRFVLDGALTDLGALLVEAGHGARSGT